VSTTARVTLPGGYLTVESVVTILFDGQPVSERKVEQFELSAGPGDELAPYLLVDVLARMHYLPVGFDWVPREGWCFGRDQIELSVEVNV
jgi:hypothetical protein